MVIPNGDLWAAQFLHSEPDYDEPAWIDAYANFLGVCKPELTADQATPAAREAFAREGDWNNPKVAACCDAVFGPLPSSKHLSNDATSAFDAPA